MIKHYDVETGVKKTKPLRNLVLAAALLGTAGFGIYLAAPGPSAARTVADGKQSVTQVAQTPATAVKPAFSAPMPWPKYGTSAFAVPKDSLVTESDASDQPVPVASLAKVITALAVMQQKPLQSGEQGPVMTLSQKDVEIYSDYVRKNGMVTYVEAGDQISQYQALQAVMMVSSNNLADSLAIQTFGSMEAYIAYANQMLKDLGLSKTTVADASGYSSSTVSTAGEMSRLGYLYMQNPVLREIAMKEEASIPAAGKIRNYNSFMNDKGVVGIKVGDTNQAGKCFMVADVRKAADGSDDISVAVVLGADSLKAASKDAQKILKAGNQGHDKIKTGITP